MVRLSGQKIGKHDFEFPVSRIVMISKGFPVFLMNCFRSSRVSSRLNSSRMDAVMVCVESVSLVLRIFA